MSYHAFHGIVGDQIEAEWPTINSNILKHMPEYANAAVYLGYPQALDYARRDTGYFLDEKWPLVENKIVGSLPNLVNASVPYVQQQALPMLNAVWPTVEQRIGAMVGPLVTSMVPQITDQVAQQLGPQLPSLVSDKLISDAVDKSVPQISSSIVKTPLGIAALTAGLLITVAAVYQLKHEWWK